MKLTPNASNVALGKACKVATSANTTNFHILSYTFMQWFGYSMVENFRVLTALSMHREFLISWGHQAEENYFHQTV